MFDPVAALLDAIRANGGAWPPAAEKGLRARIARWRAFLNGERETLKRLADWTTGTRRYKVYPLAERIADARADYLWGEDPVIRAAKPDDEELLDGMLDANDDFIGELHSAERIIAGEGEVWWRIYVDRDVADAPLLEWQGRDDVFPLYVGRKLKAAALISDLDRPRRRGPYYRHLEIHADGEVTHVLFEGQKNRLGSTVPLDSHPETAELIAEDTALELDGDFAIWRHGLPMLMGRLKNARKRGHHSAAGASDFASIEDFLLDLNEAHTIGGENARLTAKRRVVVPASAVGSLSVETDRLYGDLIDRGDGSFVPAQGTTYGHGTGQFDAGEDVLVADPADAELGGQAGQPPFKVLEYTFDADPLITWLRWLIESALVNTGLTPQWVGVSTGENDGLAISGTALRFKLIPTTAAGKRWGRPWAALPGILSLMAQVDALPADEGGFETVWNDPLAPPAIERANPLPVDEVEEATVEQTLVGAGVRSRRTSIKAQHPDWTDEQVNEELAELDRDSKAKAPALGLGIPAGA